MSGRSDSAFADYLDIYSKLILNLNTLLIIHDLEGNILKANNKFLAKLGYRSTGNYSLTVFDVVPEENQNLCRQILEETLCYGSTSHEINIIKKNRDTFPVQVFTSILEIGGTKLIQCIMHDISERIITEKKLFEASQFLDSIIENIPDMVFLKDAEELKFVRFNKAGEELLGHSREELIGKNDYDIFPRKEADFFVSKDKATLQSGNTVDIPEEEIHTSEKGVRILHTKKIGIKDEEGNPKYLLGISEDITERKQAAKLFELVVESSPCAIVMVDKDGVIKLANTHTYEMFGYSRSELIGKPIEILMPRTSNAKHIKERVKFAENPSRRQMGKGRDLKAVRKNGTEFPVDVGLSPLQISGELMTIALVVDITESKKAEEVLKKSHEELEQAVRERTSDLTQVNERLKVEVDVRKKAEQTLENYIEQLSRKSRYQEIINEVTKSVHESIELQTVLDNSVQAMIRNIDKLDIVSIYMVEGDTLVLKSHKGFTEDYIKRAGRITFPKGANWKTVIDKKSLYVPDIDYDHVLGQAGIDMGFQCYLIVPLFIDAEVVGTITIVSFEKNVYDHEELRLLEIVSRQISIAIKNAQQAEALIESTKELKKSREHFRLLLETTNVIPWEADAKTFRNTYIGPQVEKLLGYPDEQWYEEGFWDAHAHSDDRERILSERARAMETQKDYFLEYRMLTKNGEIVWIYETVSVIRENDDPKSLRGYMIDITKRKQAEELATQLGIILEESVTEVLIIDVETLMFVEANEEARKNLGYTIEEMRGMIVFDIKTQLTMREFKPIADSLLSGKVDKTNFTTIHKRKDGSTYPVEIYLQVSTMRGRKVFVANVRDITERERTNSLLMSEKNILEMISQGKQLNEILEKICLTVEKQSDDMLCSFLLLDETGTLRSGASPSLPKKYVKAIDKLPIAYGIGSCGTAAFQKEQVIVSDIATDPLWADYSDLALGHNLRACWSTPILSGKGELLGTFGMYYFEPREPRKEEFDLIERATHLARIAIEKSMSEQALNKNLERLSRKSRYDEIVSSVTRNVHSSIDLDQVLQNAVDAMHENIKDADNVGIFFIEGDFAVNKAHSGYPKEFLKKIKKIPKPKGFTWETITRGELIYCSDAESDALIGHAGKKAGTKSYVGMPIKIREDTIGCIAINSLVKDAFDEEEIKLLEIVAQQIGVAINNATQAQELKKSEEILKRNLEHISRKNRYEEVINSVSKSVHLSLDLDEVFNNAVETINEEIKEAKNVVIFMVEGDIDDKENPPYAVMKATRGYGKKFLDKLKKIPYPVGATWKVILEGKKRYVPDTEEDKVLGPAGREFGTKSYLSLPLNFEGKTVGCMHLHSTRIDWFSEEDIKLLEIVARELETAINNASKAQALRESEENLKQNIEQLSKKNRYEEIINTVSQSVHQSLDIDEVFNNAALSLGKNVNHADHVAVYMIEGDYAVLKSFTGYPKWFTDKVTRIPKPKGLTWKTLIDSVPHFSPDTSKDAYLGPAGIKVGTKSYASMPIKNGADTIGCINISSRTLNAFSEEEINLLQIVAAQIESAINNAKQAEALKISKEALRESREHFRLLVETTNVIPWEVDPETFQFTYIGPQAEDILGYPVSKWYEQDFWLNQLHEEDREITVNACMTATSALEDHELEYRFITKDGQVKWLYEMVSVISDNEKPKILRGFMIDITDRKMADDYKREAEERYRTLIEHSYDIIVETNSKGEILYSNPTFNVVLGYEQGELLGRSIFEHIHNSDRTNTIAQFSNAIERFQKGSATYRIKHKSGDWRWVESVGSPFITATGEIRAVISCRDITERMESEKKLKSALVEIEDLKNKLQMENVYLKKEIELSYSHTDIIGQSKAIKSALGKIEQVAGTDATVLLAGETGTGKEMVANRLHNLSRRKDRTMVKVNCAALPPNLIESELFGHEKGAFTGAITKNIGRFEVADGSTIFLDEVGELPPELQSKLLRVLQEGEFQRVGSSNTIKVDVRVIAATNQNLIEAVNQGKFREDLYYRLNVFPIVIPPLRERKEDIPDLLWFFITEFEKKMDKSIKNIPRKDMENLINYPWPGNVRQFRNIIERSMIVSTGPDLEIELPGFRSEAKAPSEMKPIEDVERDHISYILNITNWRIRGQSGAAEILGLKPTTLESRIKRLGIKRGH